MRSLQIIVTVFLLSITALFLSCSKQNTELDRPKVKTFKVKNATIPIIREFQGAVFGYQDIPIRARVDGFLEGVYFKEGRQVKKGQLLYKIDPTPYEARVYSSKSEVAANKAKWVKSVNDLERMKPLAESNAISQRELDAAIANEQANRSTVEASESQLKVERINLSYTRIRSPITGTIGKSEAKVGEYVGKDPNPVILNTVSRLDTVLVRFYISEKQYLSFFKYKSKLNSTKNQLVDTIKLILSDGTILPELGKVDFIDRNVDPTTGSILVQASFPNPTGIVKPGLYAKIRFKTTDDDVMIIPQKCVKELQGQMQIFIVANDTIRLRDIEIGEKWNGYYEVKSGLVEGEVIVIEGLQYIRPNIAVDAVMDSTEIKRL